MDAETVRVAIYTRVSTEDQAKEGFSLDAQLDKLRSYCKARDWEIGGEYIDDGHSGRTIKRPAYVRMMKEIDGWDILLVIKMDRIHRNSKNFMTMMEYLKQREKEFVSMSESLDTSTAMGRFVMDIIQRIAQLESEQIGERVYIGMEQKARTSSGVLGFNIPYGYNYSEGLLSICREETDVVENIYNWYKNGKSMGQIAKMLNIAKVPTKKGGIWAKKTISRILKNPLYCGYLHWQEYIYKSGHNPIIEIAEYNEIQDIIAKRRGRPAKKL
jgi:DNA invertase Pin-like site-specific DNA recombinase